MMTRRRFFAAVAGAPFLPFAPRFAALLPVAAAPAVLSQVLRCREAETGYVAGDVVEIEILVDASQPRAILAALRKELEETDALLFNAQSRQAQVLR